MTATYSPIHHHGDDTWSVWRTGSHIMEPANDRIKHMRKPWFMEMMSSTTYWCLLNCRHRRSTTGILYQAIENRKERGRKNQFTIMQSIVAEWHPTFSSPSISPYTTFTAGGHNSSKHPTMYGVIMRNGAAICETHLRSSGHFNTLSEASVTMGIHLQLYIRWLGPK